MQKEESYKWAVKQIRSKVNNHINTISTLANVSAILKERFPNFFWIGFYFFKKDHLLLGPFQGPPACVKLDINKGVCSAAANRKETVLVEDVEKFPGHIACDSRSRSEIVVPVFDSSGDLKAVLDVDSEKLNAFDSIDKLWLEKITDHLKTIW